VEAVRDIGGKRPAISVWGILPKKSWGKKEGDLIVGERTDRSYNQRGVGSKTMGGKGMALGKITTQEKLAKEINQKKFWGSRVA